MGRELLDSVANMQMQLHDMLIETKKVLQAAGVPFYLGYGTALGAVREGDYIPWDTDSDVMVSWSDYAGMLNALEGLPPPYEVAYASRTYRFEFARVARKDVPNEYLHIDLFPMVRGHRWRWLTVKRLQVARKIAFATWIRGESMLQLHSEEPKRRAKAALAYLVLGGIPRRVLRLLFNAVANLPGNGETAVNVGGSYGAREVIPREWLDNPEVVRLRGEEFLVPGPADAYLTHMYGNYARRPCDDVVAAHARVFKDWYLPVLGTVRLERARPLY